MRKSDIKKMYYNGNEIDTFYWGGNQLYKKIEYGDLDFCGVFADDVNDRNNTITIINISNKTEKIYIPYDAVTKEFKYTLTKPYSKITLEYPRNFISINHYPDTSNVTSMESMFAGCNSLTSLDLSNFNTSNVTNMGYMFSNCNALTSLDVSNFNTSNVTNMDDMFEYCRGLTSLDLSNFDTSNVTSIEYMFAGCTSLTSLDLSNFNTSNVTNMDDMFSECSSLTALDLSNFNTSNVTSMVDMIESCTGLTSLDVGNFDTSNVMSMDYMFYGCSGLTTVTGVFEGTKVNLDISDSPLTNTSAMVFINGLANVTETKTIKFKTTTYNTLTPEQIAIATSKGWTVVRN